MLRSSCCLTIYLYCGCCLTAYAEPWLLPDSLSLLWLLYDCLCWDLAAAWLPVCIVTTVWLLVLSPICLFCSCSLTACPYCGCCLTAVLSPICLFCSCSLTACPYCGCCLTAVLSPICLFSVFCSCSSDCLSWECLRKCQSTRTPEILSEYPAFSPLFAPSPGSILRTTGGMSCRV